MSTYSSMAKFIKDRIKETPDVAMILGSGLGYLTSFFENPIFISYSEIEGFPRSTVKGHSGRLVSGTFHGKKVMAMEGRFHFYEGHSIEDVVSPIYVFKELGIKNLIITNAAGGINRSFSPGDIVAVSDVINFGFRNPLRGPNMDKYGVRFPDMSDIIDSDWLKKTVELASDSDIKIKEGTYIWVTGPYYETPSEIRAYEYFGADMVGMSTVPEIIAAKHCGMKLIAFSCITNMASGILKEKLNHNDVVETANRVRSKFSKIVEFTLKTM